MTRAELDRLIVLHLPSMRRRALALTGNRRADADDLVQETVLRLLIYRHTFVGGRFAAWLSTVQTNTRRNLWGREARHGGRPVAEGDRVTGPESVTAALELRQVLALLDGLPPEMGEALIAMRVHDLTLAEAAAMQGVPVGTVKSRDFRARAWLSEATA